MTSARTRAIAFRLVRRLRHDSADEEDLVQDALVRLWTEERAHPGHSAGWYLRNCLFHLRNCLRCGRSLGSPRHRRTDRGVAGDEGDGDRRLLAMGVEGEASRGNPVFSEVVAADLAAVLAAGLSARECVVLRLLAEGQSARAAAQRMGCSHTAVLRMRRRIAALACALGVAPGAGG